MSKNKYLLLVSSIGVLALLVAAAVQENFLREWRRIQSTGRSEEGALNVQLRQVVNPTLRISDRCVSCHVSMAPGEQSVTGAKILRPHKPVVHDPAEFGCTICHGGQGQATDKADAHGEVRFWPEPMVPARYSYAGCGTCHAPLRVPNQELFARARNAYERLDCQVCHRLDGRGGTIRPDGSGMEGPDLSQVGIAGYDRGWYAKHEANSAKPSNRAWKVSWAPVSEGDRELLDVFLSTRVGAAPLIEAKAAFNSNGCLGCHKVSGVGGDEGPDLSRAGERDPGQLNFSQLTGKESLDNWFAEHFRSPSSLVPGSLMPAYGGPDRQIDLLTKYVLSLRRRELPGSYLPKDRVRAVRFGEREFAPDGASIFGAFCAGCHGQDGMGRRSPGMPAFPAIANPDFLGLVSDQFLIATIRQGRPGRRMPAWEKDGGLRPEEIQAVVAQLRKMSGTQGKAEQMPRRWVSGDPAWGKQLYSASCAGCHGKNGEGGEGLALNNKVLLSTATDNYLVQTISRGRRGTAMEGFLQSSVARPALSKPEIESIVAFIRTWEGAKP
jgi:cytochrome c oxidase cbb3-type subunit 3